MEDIFFRVFGGFLEMFTSQELLDMTAVSGIKKICEELGLGMPKIRYYFYFFRYFFKNIIVFIEEKKKKS